MVTFPGCKLYKFEEKEKKIAITAPVKDILIAILKHCFSEKKSAQGSITIEFYNSNRRNENKEPKAQLEYS